MVSPKTKKSILVFIGFRYLRWFSIGKPMQTNEKLMQTNVKPMNLVGFQRFLIISLGLRTESSCKPSLRLPQINKSLLFVLSTGPQLSFICN